MFTRTAQGGFSRKEQIAYLFLIRPFWTIKLFMNRRQIRLLNSKTTDLDWYQILRETQIAYSRLTIHALRERPHRNGTGKGTGN